MPIREHVELTAEEHVSKEMRKAEGGIDGLSSTIKKFAAGAGIAIAARKAANLTGQVLKMAVDAGEAEAAFNTTFGEALPRATAFVDQFANKAGFATFELQQMLAVTGNVVQGIGATEEQSAELSERMAVLAGDVASFSNASGGAEAVLLALQSAINGEREALKTYGLAIAETEVQQRALLETGKERAAELTRLEKAEATVAIAYEKAGKAIGDLDRTQDSAANTLRRLGARLKEAGVEAGERLLPALENILPKIEESIPAITDAAVALAEFIAAAANSAPVALLDDVLDGLRVTFNSFTNVGSGLGAFFAEVFTLGQADTSGLQATAEAAAQANDLIGIVRELRAEQVPGADAATQYANAIAEIQRRSFISAEAIAKIGDASGATADEQLNALLVLREYGREHDFTAEEISLLAARIGELNVETNRYGGAADAADVHLMNLARSSGEAGEAIGGIPEEVPAAVEAFDTMIEKAEEAAAAFREDLADEANSFITGFEKLPKRVKTTMDEFEKNLTDRVEAQQAFWEGLAELASAGFGHLAEEIRKQGPEAAGLLEDLVGNMERAAELDEMISAAGDQMGDVTDEYATALEQHGDPTLTALGQYGEEMIDAIAAGIESGDLAGPLLAKIRRDVARATSASGTPFVPPSPSSSRTSSDNIFQSGTWQVPGGPGDEMDAVLHGTEIVIPPEGTGGRAEFARQLATELAGMTTTGDRGGLNVTIESLVVTVPAGTTITEAIQAGAAEAAIEAVLS